MLTFRPPGSSAVLGPPFVIRAASAADAFAIRSNQTHVLRAAASAFVPDDVGHAK